MRSIKKMKIYNYILVLSFALLFISADSHKHEYYVSVTKIEYVEDQKSLQIISQIFIDDLEKVLRERYDESITLGKDNESKKVNSYIQRYLQQRLDIKINANETNMVFLGKEYKDDITYCYIEVENISNISKLEITNSLLFDVFQDQQNIVRLKIYDKKKSFINVIGNDKTVLNFD